LKIKKINKGRKTAERSALGTGWGRGENTLLRFKETTRKGGG
jgi:hypothetical protein